MNNKEPSNYGSVYLQKHVVEDEKQIYDLSSHNEDVKTTSWFVKTNTLQLTVELKCSYRIGLVNKHMQASMISFV